MMKPTFSCLTFLVTSLNFLALAFTKITKLSFLTLLVTKFTDGTG